MKTLHFHRPDPDGWATSRCGLSDKNSTVDRAQVTCKHCLQFLANDAAELPQKPITVRTPGDLRNALFDEIDAVRSGRVSVGHAEAMAADADKINRGQTDGVDE